MVPVEKRSQNWMMSRCFTWVPIRDLGEPNIYQNLVCITMCGDFTWMVSDCEELGWVI